MMKGSLSIEKAAGWLIKENKVTEGVETVSGEMTKQEFKCFKYKHMLSITWVCFKSAHIVNVSESTTGKVYGILLIAAITLDIYIM